MSKQKKEAKKDSNLKVKCPRCTKTITYCTSNPFRPFCSPLCKNEDLGDWAQESFRIPVKEANGLDGLHHEDEEN